MKFYFDESGVFFAPEDRMRHAVGIVVGVVVPETAEEDLWRRFRQFISTLPVSAFKNGEPKGRLLDAGARRSFAILMSECDAIQVCPTILDLTSIAGRALKLRDGLAGKLQETASRCVFERMRQQVGSLADQVRKLSPQQSLRLRAWAQSAIRCIEDSIRAHSGQEFDSCWAKMTFEIDAVEENGGSREEEVFSNMLPAWAAAWYEKHPIMLIEEIHTENHPFVREWETDLGIDLGKMFRGNLRFSPSHNSLGIQVADMAASVVRWAVHRIVTPDNLTSYGVMMSNSVRSATHAHGIISFADMNQADAARYRGLVEGLSFARHQAGIR